MPADLKSPSNLVRKVLQSEYSHIQQLHFGHMYTCDTGDVCFIQKSKPYSKKYRKQILLYLCTNVLRALDVGNSRSVPQGQVIVKCFHPLKELYWSEIGHSICCIHNFPQFPKTPSSLECVLSQLLLFAVFSSSHTVDVAFVIVT